MTLMWWEITLVSIKGKHCSRQLIMSNTFNFSQVGSLKVFIIVNVMMLKTIIKKNYMSKKLWWEWSATRSAFGKPASKKRDSSQIRSATTSRIRYATLPRNSIKLNTKWIQVCGLGVPEPIGCQVTTEYFNAVVGESFCIMFVIFNRVYKRCIWVCF